MQDKRGPGFPRLARTAGRSRMCRAHTLLSRRGVGGIQDPRSLPSPSAPLPTAPSDWDRQTVGVYIMGVGRG